jgi:hypothetical protein
MRKKHVKDTKEYGFPQKELSNCRSSHENKMYHNRKREPILESKDC